MSRINTHDSKVIDISFPSTLYSGGPGVWACMCLCSVRIYCTMNISPVHRAELKKCRIHAKVVGNQCSDLASSQDTTLPQCINLGIFPLLVHWQSESVPFILQVTKFHDDLARNVTESLVKTWVCARVAYSKTLDASWKRHSGVATCENTRISPF